MKKSTNRFQRAESALAGLGARLREARGERTQEDFAAVLGVPRQQYARYEKGRIPDPLHLLHIAIEIGLSLDDLFGLPAQASGQRVVAHDTQPSPPTVGLSGEFTSEELAEQQKMWGQFMRIYRNRRTDKVAQRLFDTMVAALETYEAARPEAPPPPVGRAADVGAGS